MMLYIVKITMNYKTSSAFTSLVSEYLGYSQHGYARSTAKNMFKHGTKQLWRVLVSNQEAAIVRANGQIAVISKITPLEMI